MYVYYCIIYVYSHLCISSCMYHIINNILYITCDTPMTVTTMTLLWELTHFPAGCSSRECLGSVGPMGMEDLKLWIASGKC